VSNTAVYNWLRGTQPGPTLIPEIARVLKLDERTIALAAGYPVRDDSATRGEPTPMATAEYQQLAREFRDWAREGAELMHRLEQYFARWAA
jgi:hypothetical protein